MLRSGKSLKESVNEALRRGLLSHQSTRKTKTYKVRAKSLGLKPGYSFDKTWDLIEAIEGPSHP